MLDRDLDYNDLGTKEIKRLSEISSSLNTGISHPDKELNAYQEQLELIHILLEPFDHAVLHGLSGILSEGLNLLINEKRQLTVGECLFLKKIPEILSEYIFIPTSKIPDAHLLSHFKNPAWIRPINEAEEKKFISLLTEDATQPKIEEPEGQYTVVDVAVEENDEPEIDILDLLDVNVVDEKESDIDVIVLDNHSPDQNSIGVSDENDEDVLDIASLVDKYENKPLQLLANNADIAIDEAEDSDVLDLSTFSQQDDIETASLNLIDSAGTSLAISQEQQELIALVIYELEDINVEDEFICIRNIDEVEQLKENLINVAELVENISNAVELIGFEGLANASRHISGNIHLLALANKKLSDEEISLVEIWHTNILSYLNNIADAQVSDDLLHYLNNPLWPDQVSDETYRSIENLLKAPQLKEEEKELRQRVANPDDMSLELPEDVNPELLEGLLQDLPVQSGEFSVAIQNLQEQDNLEYLEVAQRIAHTLKGAGNVVGVKGIANLTHHLEDILEIQSKAGKLPSQDLLNILIDAADCLETMSEALLGIDEPPDNGTSVYQAILDWANRLDTEGATDSALDEDESNTSIQLNEIKNNELSLEKEVQDEVKKPVQAENMLRVPARLADDLLRLAGENLISTSQIQEYIKIIQARHKGLKTHDHALQKLSFDLEHIVDVQGIANAGNDYTLTDDFDPLELDQYHELHSMSRRLIELAADSIELTQVLEKDFAHLQGLVLTQDRLQKENEELVLRTRMVPTKTIIPRLKRGVKQACRLTGKQVELEVNDNDTYMDSEVLNGLIEPLMHILRNSVDHGIEPKEARINANKNSTGHIELVFSRLGDQIMIDVKDDGNGLSLEKIREKALSMGLVEKGNDVTKLNLQKFILQPGFSTRAQVSQVSGRGIGLDVVNSKIRELKGSISIRSVEGRSCLFSLTLPISSFSVHSLLVRVRENIYAFSNRGVEEILYPGLGMLQEIDNEVMFKLGDELYNTSLVETLLNISEERRSIERKNRPVMLVKDDTGSKTAVLVQEVIDSRDVVVKSMGPYIPKIPGVVGATVLGDGSIAPVIDVPELMQSSKNRDGKIHYHSAEKEKEEDTSLPYVLVVDDSLSARNSLAQFVEDLGLDVRTARDGMEAVSLIDSHKPDLVLVDMEMPRMNGLELTSHIRATDNTKDMPVIMITSRSTDKHRKAAMDKGVNHYMVKPFAEDELASHINVALEIA